MILTRESIKRETYARTFQKGEQLYRQGAVEKVREIEEMNAMHVSALVWGSNGHSYHTSLEINLEYEEIVDYECECPAFFQYDGLCKHCVALALSYAPEPKQIDLNAFLNKNKKDTGRVSTDALVSKLIFDYSMDGRARFFQPEVSGRIELEPKLHMGYSGWSVDFRVGAEAKYVVKDLHSFLDSVEKREKVNYGKKLGFIHEPGAFTEESRRILEFLQKYMEEYRYFHGGGGLGYHYYFSAMRALPLSSDAKGAFCHLMVGRQIKVEDDYSQVNSLEILAQDPPLTFQLERIKDRKGFMLTVPALEAFYGDGRLYVRRGEQIYECSQEYSSQMRRVCSMGKGNQAVSFAISEGDMSSFCSTLLPILQKHTEVLVDGDLGSYMPQECLVKIYLDNQGGLVTARLEGEYGEERYNLLSPVQVMDAFRDTERESAAVRVVGAYFSGTTADDQYALEEWEEDQLYQLLTTGLTQISQVGELYISDAFKRMKVSKAPKVAIGISLSGGLIDLQMDSGSLSPEELEGFLASYRKRRKFFRLKDGSFMELEDNSAAMVSELMDGLDLDAGELKEGKVQIPKYQAFYLNQVLKEEAEGVEVFRDHAFKSIIRDMKSVEDSDYEVPKTLKNVLRAYQKTGFRWLCTLDAMGFGGILADDMGLGKTLQVIAFLLFQKEQGRGKAPSLIVCPASLVYNWQSELERFAGDGLSVLTVAGNQEERKKALEECGDYDVLITSYDLLKRDVEQYEAISFYAQILDEAQNIKNHATKAAKAAKAIQAQTRFALTGTPIENRLSELWSIFDYLMPGFLGSYERFKKDFESPIVQNQDQVMTARLQRMIKPFILRRIKAEVLKDLPEKEENIVYTRLEGEQKKLYTANVQRLLESLGSKTEEEVGSSKLQILAELTRLRQICCEPGMVYEDYKGESAKLDTCMELLKNAFEGGHKVLLFSQFTTLFTLLEKRLGKERIPFYKLTGATPKAKRMEMVRQFNEPESKVPLFLISLKAGGTGLNLTGADIVIHFDPWWNVAAQNQATDRAHRIGQKNSVSVFKLIARDTIEEKIVKLQEAKKDLADQIISEAGVSVSNLTKEDFMGLLKP